MKDEPVGKSIAKQLRKRIDAAGHALDHTRLSDKQVHEARKDLKKARSSLRLLRPGLKNARYRAHNAALRDAAKPLSAVRDARVLLDVLQGLAEHYGAPARALKIGGFKRALANRRLRIRREILGADGNALGHSRHLLRQSRKRTEDLKRRKTGDWRVVGKGLKRIYAQGRRAMTVAEDQQTPGAFHEWRKQAKHLRYSLEWLQPLWPGLIGELARQTHKLADYLGDEHDLTVLRETALADRESFGDDDSLSAFLALIEQRQLELREKALILGSKLYEEKPKAFMQRFDRYWQEWRNEKATAVSLLAPA